MIRLQGARVPLVLAVVLAFIAAACGGTATAPAATARPSVAATAASAATPAPTAAPTQAPPDKVTVLTDFLLFGWHSPLFAGKAEKFYSDQRIDLTIQAGAGSADGATKVAAGAAQFGQLDATSALVAIGKGADLKIVGVYFKKYPGGMCYIQERKPLKTWKDFEGLKVGAANGDAYMVALPALMKAGGADPAKVQTVTMDGAATSAALVAGQVEGTPCGLPTFSSRAAAAAKEKLTANFFSFGDNGSDALGFVLVTSGKTAQQQPDLVQRFVNAWAKSAVWSLANGDKAVGHFLAANADKNKDIETQSFKDVIPLLKGGATQYFVLDAPQVTKTVAFVNDAYKVTLKPADVYTNQFVDKLSDAFKAGKLQ